MTRIPMVLALAGLVAVMAAGMSHSQNTTNTGGNASADVGPLGPIPGRGSDTAVSNPYQDDEAALQQGRRLFVDFNCSGCHGGHAGGGMGPSLRDKAWIYGSTDGEIFASIADGRANGMPAWKTMLPDQSIWKLVAYIQSLRTQREPDAPSSN